MKKTALLSLVIALISCGDGTNSGVSTPDTPGQKNPDGVINQNRISTDTGAYKVDSSSISPKAEKLADSAI